MQDDTKVNLNVSNYHQPAAMQMSRPVLLNSLRIRNFLSSIHFTFWWTDE